MKEAQFRNEKGKWVAIPLFNATADLQQAAFNHCKQFGIATRVVDIKDGKEGKKEEEVIHEFRCQRKSSNRKV